MSLVKFKNRPLNPNSWFDDFFSDDYFLVPPRNNESVPATNIEENEKEFVLDIAVPGMKKENIHVEVENGNLCISAEDEQSSEEKEKNYMRREYNYSSFKRFFALPENVKETVAANYKDGVLHIVVPKKELEISKVKRIKVA